MNKEVELWRAVVGHEGLYEVSNLGNVRRVGSQRCLRPWILKTGYLQVHLCKDGERIGRCVHTLVIEAFVGPRPSGKQCAHLDGSRTNCRVANLKWVTPKENEAHKKRHGTYTFGENHYNARFSFDDVCNARQLRNSGLTMCKISQLTGISFSHVHRIIHQQSRVGS